MVGVVASCSTADVVPDQPAFDNNMRNLVPLPLDIKTRHEEQHLTTQGYCWCLIYHAEFVQPSSNAIPDARFDSGSRHLVCYAYVCHLTRTLSLGLCTHQECIIHPPRHQDALIVLSVTALYRSRRQGKTLVFTNPSLVAC
jgi:hypothetical protein